MSDCLKWGLGADGMLLFISTQRSGKTHLVCPFCSVPVIAIRGGKLKPHFRHVGTSCNSRGKTLTHDPGWNLYDEIEKPKEFLYKTLSSIGLHREKIDEIVQGIEKVGRLNYFCRRSKEIINSFRSKSVSAKRNLVVAAISAELNQRSLFF
jgi:hypothetical protein